MYLLAKMALSGKVTFLSRELVFSRILIIFSIKTWLYLASALPFKVSSYKVVNPKLRVTFDENFWQVSINWWGGRGTDFGLIMPGKMSAFNHKSNVNFFWKLSENFVKSMMRDRILVRTLVWIESIILRHSSRPQIILKSSLTTFKVPDAC